MKIDIDESRCWHQRHFFRKQAHSLEIHEPRREGTTVQSAQIHHGGLEDTRSGLNSPIDLEACIVFTVQVCAI